MHPSLRIITKWFFILALVIGGITYGFIQSFAMIRGPLVTITHPENGTTVTSPLVEIVGEVENIAYISLNGEQIYTDETGAFREKLIAAPGYNALIVQVQDKFNRIRQEKVELYYKEADVLPSAGVVTEASTEAVYQ